MAPAPPPGEGSNLDKTYPPTSSQRARARTALRSPRTNEKPREISQRGAFQVSTREFPPRGVIIVSADARRPSRRDDDAPRPRDARARALEREQRRCDAPLSVVDPSPGRRRAPEPLVRKNCDEKIPRPPLSRRARGVRGGRARDEPTPARAHGHASGSPRAFLLGRRRRGQLPHRVSQPAHPRLCVPASPPSSTRRDAFSRDPLRAPTILRSRSLPDFSRRQTAAAAGRSAPPRL